MKYSGFEKEDHLDGISLYCGDCMDLLKQTPDKYYSLALVDPPYGIDLANMNMGVGKSKRSSKIENRKWKPKDWDKKTPSNEYFNEIFRVSKNQIIWGGNYFTLPCSRGWIFWDKGIDGDCSFADGELAWTSFDVVLRKANVRYKGFLGMDKERIHPTQKPVQLYKWILNKYAKEGDTILDTHLGSGSSAIASHDGGFEFTGIELDEEYYNAAKERIMLHQRQLNLF